MTWGASDATDPAMGSPYSDMSSPCRPMDSPYPEIDSPYPDMTSPYPEMRSPYPELDSPYRDMDCTFPQMSLPHPKAVSCDMMGLDDDVFEEEQNQDEDCNQEEITERKASVVDQTDLVLDQLRQFERRCGLEQLDQAETNNRTGQQDLRRRGSVASGSFSSRAIPGAAKNMENKGKDIVLRRMKTISVNRSRRTPPLLEHRDMLVLDRADNNNRRTETEESGQQGAARIQAASRALSFNTYTPSKTSWKLGSRRAADSPEEVSPAISDTDQSEAGSGRVQVCAGTGRAKRGDQCLVCGDPKLDAGRALCQDCITQTKQDSPRSGGPIEELYAYAQNLAQTVRKILLTPASADCVQTEPRPTGRHCTATKTTEEMVAGRNMADVPLQRYRTEMNLINPHTSRSKSLLNKSVSYDGRCEDKNASWSRGQDKAKLSGSLVKLNGEACMCRHGSDSFTSGKDLKRLLDQETDKSSRFGKLDRAKSKHFLKQLARVERARTDGDLRPNPSPQGLASKKSGKEETRKGGEFIRNRSKTFYEVVDEESDEEDECPPRVINESRVISRLKVIHEGTPVDPPCSLDAKKADETRGRKAAFIRSMTAPYRNQPCRREITMATMEACVRTNRSNSKITVRTNKASMLRKENSLGERRKTTDMMEPPDHASGRDDLTAMSFNRRRSTSCDGRQQYRDRSDDAHRSTSWSAVEAQDNDGTLKRETSSTETVTMKANILPARLSHSSFFSECSRPGTPPSRGWSDAFVLEQLPGTSTKTTSRDDSSRVPISDRTEVSPEVRGQDVNRSPSHFSSYCDTDRYYRYNTESRPLSPCIEEVVLESLSQPLVGYTSYYGYQDAMAAMTQNVNIHHPVFSQEEESQVYHDERDTYTSPPPSQETKAPWYSPLPDSDEPALCRRDRSLGSKSSTSFHLLHTVKSSHSDDALRKFVWPADHQLIPPRRQSMYTETDVDTGLIYHLAKRQAARAQLPAYTDLAAVLKDLYTTSGDVNSQASSQSSSRTSSGDQITDCMYTGGFYHQQTSRDSDSSSSSSTSSSGSSSSGQSVNNIYYEVSGLSKREPSQLDIYTGHIFNSNQNTSSGDVFTGSITVLPQGVLNDKKETMERPNLPRLQRSVKQRPRVDVYKPVSYESSSWNYPSMSVVANYSNNSNNWYGQDSYEAAFNQGSVVTKSREPLYTDYDTSLRPEFHIKSIEKQAFEADYLTYEDSCSICPTCPIGPCPVRDQSSGDSSWYSGPLISQKQDSSQLTHRSLPPQVAPAVFPWQYYDDYYTSTVRPRVNRSNNCNSDLVQYNSSHSDLNEYNLNNNHLEDLYTGFYGAQNVKATIPEPPPQARPPPINESWYAPMPKNTSSNFYEQGDEYAAYPAGGEPRHTLSGFFDPDRNERRASSGIFTQETSSYASASSYVEEPWYKYDARPARPFQEPEVMRPPIRPIAEETDSYFDYISSKSPGAGFYNIDPPRAPPERSFYALDDDGTYSFEPKVMKEPHQPGMPVIHEVKTVGGIVCRENVANKEDYAEDINRDLEPGSWMPFSIRRDDDFRHSEGGSGGSGEMGQAGRHTEDSPYAMNRVYDNAGPRNNWREMATKRESEVAKSRAGGDVGKQTNLGKGAGDIIPDRARGGRKPVANVSKPVPVETSHSPCRSQGQNSARNTKKR